MDSVAVVLRGLEVVSVVLAFIAVPVLGSAVIGRYRDVRRVPRLSWSVGWVAMALVGVAVGVAGVVALEGDVPFAGGWVFAVVVVLVGLLFAGDDRFWLVTATLFVVFTGIGLVLLSGVASSFVDEVNGDAWYGTRWLVHTGGIGANPTREGWWVAVGAVAVLRFGLPLALMVAAAYQASTRRDLLPLERFGLTVVAGSAGAASFGSSAFQLVAFIVGVFVGLPPALGAACVLGSLLLVLVVGPGSVDAVLVGGRTLWSWSPGGVRPFIDAAGTVREAAGVGSGAAGSTSVARSPGVVRWAADNIGWSSRLWVRGGVLVAVLSALGWAGIWGTRAEPERVTFEPVDVEVGVDFVVVDTFAGPEGRLWLVGDDGRAAIFDSRSKSAFPVEGDGSIMAASPGPDPGELVGLMATTPPALVLFNPDGGSATELGTLEGLDVVDGSSLAVWDDIVYVATADGTIGRWPITGGEPTASVTDETGVTIVGANRAGVWTLLPVDTGWVGDFKEQLREPDGLAPIDNGIRPDPDDLTLGVTDLAVGSDQVVSVVDFVTTVSSEPGSSETSGGDWSGSEDGWLIPADDAAVWLAEPYGSLTLYEPHTEPERWYFHYDSVVGILDAGTDGTWVVGVNDRGTIIETTTVNHSTVARWMDPHPAQASG